MKVFRVEPLSYLCRVGALNSELKKKIIGEVQSHFAQEALAPGLPAEEKKELERLSSVFRFFPSRPFESGDPISPGSLVRLELGARSALYLLVPQGGGLVLAVDGEPVQVITDQSPLGAELLGKHVGDTIEVAGRAERRKYRLVDHV